MPYLAQLDAGAAQGLARRPRSRHRKMSANAELRAASDEDAPAHRQARAWRAAGRRARRARVAAVRPPSDGRRAPSRLLKGASVDVANAVDKRLDLRIGSVRS